MYKEVVFNGKYMWLKEKRGVQRYTQEVLRALDKQIPKGAVKVIIPHHCAQKDTFENIEVIEYGGRITHYLWQFLAFQWYVWTHRAFSVCLSCCSLFGMGIFALHDVRYIDDSKKSWKYCLSLKTLMIRFSSWIGALTAKALVTVSEFSKREIIEKYNIRPDKISVCYNAWQHFATSEKPDESIFSRFPQIKKHEYYFMLGGMEDNKNIKWTVMMAKKYPERMFVFSGPSAINAIFDADTGIEKMSNCVHVGYVSDGELKALMGNCRAFLFPSKYEGFGIPPMEAMSCGAKVLMSNSTCLPEVYKEYVSYFDPDDYSVDLDALEAQKHPDAKFLLAQYSWDKTASQIRELIHKYSGLL